MNARKKPNVIENQAIMYYIQLAKKNGWCDQCCFPWYDGLCDCGNSERQEVKDALELALMLEKQGYEL